VHDPIVLEVMALHADDERRHIAMDKLVLREARDRLPTWQLRIDVWSVLPLLVHCDRSARAGWKRMTTQLASEHGIDRSPIEDRSTSLSDRRGMESFAVQLRRLELPEGARLAAVLERMVRA